MSFEEFTNRIKSLDFTEIRENSSDLFEFVTSTGQEELLKHELINYFDSPLKPPEDRPSKIAKKYAAPFGGIRHGQTLYCKENGDILQLAFLWPWDDGESVTVKIFRVEKSFFEQQSEGLLKRIIRKILSI